MTKNQTIIYYSRNKSGLRRMCVWGGRGQGVKGNKKKGKDERKVDVRKKI